MDENRFEQDIRQEVIRKCGGVSIEMNFGKDQSLTVVMTGKLDPLQKAKEIVMKQLETIRKRVHHTPESNFTTEGAKGVLSHIDQVLLCQICFHPLVKLKARTLSCLHTFCEDCLTNIQRRQPGRQITCSICRQPTELRSGKVTDLPLNFNIKHAQEMAETMTKTSFCSKCCIKKEYVPATRICITCKWTMCQSCKAKHDKLPGFAVHQVETLEPERSDSVEQTCRTHESSARLFCGKCKLLLCTQCLIEDMHETHIDDIQSADVALSDIKSLLSSKKSVLSDGLEYVRQEIAVITQQRQYLQKVKKEIVQTGDSIKSRVEENVKEMLTELEENYIKKLESRNVRLHDALQKGTPCLKSTQGSEGNAVIDVLKRRESWIRDTTVTERLISELKKDEHVSMVKFTKRCDVQDLGSLDKTDTWKPDLQIMDNI